MTSPTPVILIVEDDLDIVAVVTSVLTEEDCTVVWASDGETAVELTARQPVDLVLMDIGLPQMSGEAVALHLRLLPEPPPVILFSAAADLAAIATRVGAVDYIHKPFDLDDLTDKVHGAIRRRAP